MTYKTVTELAEELNISRQAIQKRIKKLPPDKHPKKVDGKYRLSEEVVKEMLKKQQGEEPVTTSSDNLPTSKLSPDNLNILTIFSEDKQQLYKIISNLENRLEESQLLLSQQQQLTLQSNKQIDKLQLQLEITSIKPKESASNQEQELNDLKNELLQKNEENEQLKMEVEQLQKKSKKGFWQHLFNS